MDKLNVSNISDAEAFQYRKTQLNAMRMNSNDTRVCVIPKKGMSYSYTPKQALESLEAHMSGKPNKIGELELKVGKVSLAYERSHHR